MVTDINSLARELYEHPEQEQAINRTKKVREKVPSTEKSSYHNSSSRGQAALSGEDAAVAYLEQKGYKIERRNYRCYCGEIDIIASKGPVLVFVEVKTRSNDLYGRPAEAVTYGKQQKIRRSAESYLKMTGRLQNMPPVSFDVIEVIRQRGAIKSLNHLEHCF